MAFNKRPKRAIALRMMSKKEREDKTSIFDSKQWKDRRNRNIVKQYGTGKKDSVS